MNTKIIAVSDAATHSIVIYFADAKMLDDGTFIMDYEANESYVEALEHFGIGVKSVNWTAPDEPHAEVVLAGTQENLMSLLRHWYEGISDAALMRDYILRSL